MVSKVLLHSPVMKSTIGTMFTGSMVSTSSKRPIIVQLVSMSTLVNC